MKYQAKMYEHLTTGGCYKKLEKDPSTKIIKDVANAIKRSNLDEGIKKKLIPKNPIIPRIYGLPKIHKNGVPLRPIVNTIGSPTYQLVKFLAKTLKPLVGHTFSYIKDSSHFVNGIKNIHMNENDIYWSASMWSLFTQKFLLKMLLGLSRISLMMK
jgi:hypothetical protein